MPIEPQRRRRRLYSVESFGTKVLAILMHGARGQHEFTAPWNRVIRLRQRIYQLREAMRREQHAMYPLVSKVQITIPDYPDPRIGPKPPTSEVRAILGPTDHQYDDIIAQLNIEPGLGETDIEPIATTVAAPLGTSIEDLLQGTKGKPR